MRLCVPDLIPVNCVADRSIFSSPPCCRGRRCLGLVSVLYNSLLLVFPQFHLHASILAFIYTSHATVSSSMKSLFRPFPLPLTNKQWFYILVLQGLGAGIIDFGANFGIAYAMYHNQHVVKMWVFSQNTIAGDLGVTPIIQCLASMLISSTLVHSDLHHSQIKPLPFVYPHVEHLPDPRLLFSRSRKRGGLARNTSKEEGTSGTHSIDSVAVVDNEKSRAYQGQGEHTYTGFSYYFWMLIRFIFEGTEKNMLLAKPGFANWFGRFIWTAAQGAALGVVLGFPIWCLAIVILGPIYQNDNMGNKWAPQVIKGVYGAVVGWVTNPVIALLALGSQADHHLIVVEHVDEEATIAGDAGAGEAGERGEEEELERVETIHEDEELPIPTGMGMDSSRRSSRFSPSTRPVSIVSRRRSSIPSPLILQHQHQSHHPTSPTPNRSRAGSATSSSIIPISARPPLTANVSHLSPLPSDLAAVSSMGLGVSLGTPLPAPTPIGRARGTSVGASASGYGYALGGTGGRANRSRSGSVVTVARSLHGQGQGGGGELGNSTRQREEDRGGRRRGSIPAFKLSNASAGAEAGAQGSDPFNRPELGSGSEGMDTGLDSGTSYFPGTSSTSARFHDGGFGTGIGTTPPATIRTLGGSANASRNGSLIPPDVGAGVRNRSGSAGSWDVFGRRESTATPKQT